MRLHFALDKQLMRFHFTLDKQLMRLHFALERNSFWLRQLFFCFFYIQIFRYPDIKGSIFDFYNWTVVGFWPRLLLTLSSAAQIDLLGWETYVTRTYFFLGPKITENEVKINQIDLLGWETYVKKRWNLFLISHAAIKTHVKILFNAERNNFLDKQSNMPGKKTQMKLHQK